jgi:uncharacterized protein YfdQ (DUF2303 family)
MSDEQSNTQAAIDAGLALADPTPIERGALYSVLVPDGGAHTVLDTEKQSVAPWRPRSVYRPATVDALIAVVSRHHTGEETTIWVHPTDGRIVAIFNDNATAGPGWRDHRAELQLRPTDEWRHWLCHDGHLLSQVEFAEHIEQGLAEIVKPDAADMLELTQTISASSGANFRSAIRLHDGRVQAKYEETIDAQAGESGQLDIPTELSLAIAPFLGEEPFALTARFRYRLSSGQLTMGYKLDRPDAAVRQALSEIAGKLVAEFKDTDVFIGEAGV